MAVVELGDWEVSSIIQAGVRLVISMQAMMWAGLGLANVKAEAVGCSITRTQGCRLGNGYGHWLLRGEGHLADS